MKTKNRDLIRKSVEEKKNEFNGDKIKSILPDTWVILTFIFIVAVIIRMVYISQVISTPVFMGLSVDSEQFDNFALEIVKGNLFDKESVYLSPFYPLFLSFIYSIFGHSHMPVIIIQGVLDSISCILIFYIASLIFDRKTGIISSIIYCFYGIVIFYTGILLAATLVIFFLLLFFSVILFAVKKQNIYLFLLAGLLLGIVFSARPNIIILLAVLPLWFFRGLKKRLGFTKAICGFLILCAGFSFVLSLIAFRNHSITGRFSPFSVQGGFNFYIGNHSGADGSFNSPHGISASAVKQIKESILYAEKENGQKLSPKEASSFWFWKSVEYIINSPGSAIKLFLMKTVLFWRHEELSLNIDYTFNRSFIPLFNFPFIAFGFIAPLSLIGIGLAVWKKEDVFLLVLFILTYMFSVILFFVSDRYRLPVVPFLIIPASYLIRSWKEMILKGDKKVTIWIISALLILFLLVNRDFKYFHMKVKGKRANTITNIGSVYYKNELYDKAVKEFKRAIKISPKNERAYLSLGAAYFKKEQYQNAVREYKKVLVFNPDNDKAYLGMGKIYFHQGLYEEAIDEFKSATELNAGNVEAYYNLGNAYFQLDKMEEAVQNFKKVIDLNDENDMAHNNLGCALYYMGKVDEAILRHKKAIELNPGNANAWSNLGNMYFAKGFLDKAIEKYKQAIRLEPRHADARGNLGNVYQKKGMTEEAVKEWKRALEIQPENKMLQQKILGAEQLLKQ